MHRNYALLENTLQHARSLFKSAVNHRAKNLSKVRSSPFFAIFSAAPSFLHRALLLRKLPQEQKDTRARATDRALIGRGCRYGLYGFVRSGKYVEGCAARVIYSVLSLSGTNEDIKFGGSLFRRGEEISALRGFFRTIRAHTRTSTAMLYTNTG